MTAWRNSLAPDSYIVYAIGIIPLVHATLVREQVDAISNLKIDKGTVWDSGKNANGKSGTADFISGLISALPPLHELARNAGLEMPAYLGELQKQAANSNSAEGAKANGATTGD
ncbi:hypothetical protein BH18VER1_BH18VER1_10030 [soil metagenome]